MNHHELRPLQGLPAFVDVQELGEKVASHDVEHFDVRGIASCFPVKHGVEDVAYMHLWIRVGGNRKGLSKVAEGNAADSSCGKSARDPDIAGHGGKGACGSVILLAVGGAPCSPAGHQGRRFQGCVFAGQGRNRIGPCAGDPLSPGRSFRKAVLFSKNIVGKGFKAVGMGAEEIPIMKFFRDHHKGHGDHHRCIRARFYGDPPVGQSFPRMVQPGVHTNDPGAGLFRPAQVVNRVRTEPGHHRVKAPQDNQL